jgi:hypothetical protein
MLKIKAAALDQSAAAFCSEGVWFAGCEVDALY